MNADQFEYEQRWLNRGAYQEARLCDLLHVVAAADALWRGHAEFGDQLPDECVQGLYDALGKCKGTSAHHFETTAPGSVPPVARTTK